MEEISSRRAFCLAKAGGRTPMEIKWGCGDEEPLSGSTAQAPETEEALARLAQAGHLPPESARDLTRALDLCWRVQGYLRLAVSEQFDPATAPASLSAGVARAVLGSESADIEDAADLLRTRLNAAQKRCRAIFDQD